MKISGEIKKDFVTLVIEIGLGRNNDGLEKVYIRQPHDSNFMVLSCADEFILAELRGVLDGAKVRDKPAIVFRKEAVVNISNVKNIFPIFDFVSQESFDKIKSNKVIRETNIKKIRDSYYEENIYFPYECKGIYEPMKHQKIIFNAMRFTDKSGIISEAGTCKTAPYLWLIDNRLSEGKVKKVLIITLSGLKQVVYGEMEKQTPHLLERTIIINGKQHADNVVNKTHKRLKLNIDYDIYINNYESMRTFIGVCEGKLNFDMVICDEGHRIGAHDSQQTKAIVAAFEDVKYKYIVTGSLNSNNLMSFFSPFRFLGADTVPYSSFNEFRIRFMRQVDPFGYIWKPISQEHIKAVSKIIGSITVMFTKEECLDLPGVIYNKRYYEMTCDQKEAHKEVEKNLIFHFNAKCDLCTKKTICKKETPCEIVKVKGALVATTKLSQVAMGFYNQSIKIIDDETQLETVDNNTLFFPNNQRVKILEEILDEIGENKAIIWCYSVIFLEHIVIPFFKEKHSGKFLTCYGKDNAFDVVNEFKDDKYQYLIGNPTKLGVGQNIQFTSYAVFINNSYSYVARDQAISRQDRGGQKNVVTIYDIIARDSIDEKIIKALDNKEDLDIKLSLISKVNRLATVE